MPYSPSAEPLTRLADGTVKQISPFTGTEVWTVPGRANRPISHPVAEVRPLKEADRTHTTVRTLNHAGRVQELARMIGGAGGAEDTSALQHAESMLTQAAQAKESAAN
mgnify:CR=1 FL=1